MFSDVVGCFKSTNAIYPKMPNLCTVTVFVKLHKIYLNDRIFMPLHRYACCQMSVIAADSGLWTHEVREVISSLSRHETSRVGKPSDVLNVGVKLRRIRFQHNVDQSRQKVISTRWTFRPGLSQSLEYELAAAYDECQLVLWRVLRIHFNYRCKTWHRDGVRNTVEQNSSIFFLIWICLLPPAMACGQ